MNNAGAGTTRYFNSSPEPEVKKCSRCRVKRVDEPPELLNKYATCSNCRRKRKVVKLPIDLATIPNMFTNFDEFIDKIKTNVTHDVFDHHFRGETKPSEIKRYNTEIDSVTYQQVARQLIEIYITPLMMETGYRFAVRDYHKGGGKTKKIAFMFICSQDRQRQRRSRSTSKRTVSNKLKVQLCNSKIALNYSLNDGIVNIQYTHKAHEPYSWGKRTKEEEEEDRTNSHYLTEHYHTLQQHHNHQQYSQLPSHQQLQLPSLNQRYTNVLDTFSTQAQNTSQYNANHLSQIQFSQFHIPLTQQYHSAHTNPPTTTTNIIDNSTGNSSSSNVTTGLPIPHVQPTTTSSPLSQQVEEAAVIIANATQQQQYRSAMVENGEVGEKVDIVKHENIDKDLIGLQP